MLGRELMPIQVYSGEFGDTQAASIDTYWYDLPTSSLRRNKYIVPAEKTNPLRVIASTELLEGTDAFRGFVYPSALLPHKFGSAGSNLLVEHKQTPVSVYVLADFDSDEGSALLQAVLTSMVSIAPCQITYSHGLVGRRRCCSLRFLPCTFATQGRSPIHLHTFIAYFIF
jgi:UDP-glucose:glycoprotein glucosyltransferase